MTTTTSAHHSLKLSIPQSQEPGISIVGVLEQLEPGKTRGKKLALVRDRTKFLSLYTCAQVLITCQILHGSLG